jgi:hypothetical protein
LSTPWFQRNANCGTRSPNPVTESLRLPETVKPIGPIAAVSVPSTSACERPNGISRATAAWAPKIFSVNT